MDFEKYSKEQFESRDDASARRLADELQDDVTEEIHGAVYEAVQNVIKGLNGQGHKLTPYEEIRPGDVSFRDEPVEGQCYLRLACDVVISAGYSDTRTVDEVEAEI
jgi:hypothetical protein